MNMRIQKLTIWALHSSRNVNNEIFIDAFIRRNPNCTLIKHSLEMDLRWCTRTNLVYDSIINLSDICNYFVCIGICFGDTVSTFCCLHCCQIDQLASSVFIQSECGDKGKPLLVKYGARLLISKWDSPGRRNRPPHYSNCWLCQKTLNDCGEKVWLGLLYFCPWMEASKAKEKRNIG